MYDRHASHMNKTVLSALKRHHQTTAVFIPPGLTPIVQPCDVSWNKPFKSAMREKWQEWLRSGEQEFTKSGNRKSASYKMVAEWVDECWKATDNTLIAKSFNACGIVTPENGETLNSRLQLLIGGGSLESDLSHSDFSDESDDESDDKSDDESDDQSDDQSDDESERPDESTRSR